MIHRASGNKAVPAALAASGWGSPTHHHLDRDVDLAVQVALAVGVQGDEGRLVVRVNGCGAGVCREPDSLASRTRGRTRGLGGRGARGGMVRRHTHARDCLPVCPGSRSLLALQGGYGWAWGPSTHLSARTCPPLARSTVPQCGCWSAAGTCAAGRHAGWPTRSSMGSIKPGVQGQPLLACNSPRSASASLPACLLHTVPPCPALAGPAPSSRPAAPAVPPSSLSTLAGRHVVPGRGPGEGGTVGDPGVGHQPGRRLARKRVGAVQGAAGGGWGGRI